MHLKSALPFLAAALMPTAALAHGVGDHVHSLAEGLAHPVTGADHLLAMVAVGAMAVRAGGRTGPALPAVFVAAMAAGAGLAMTGAALPGVEGLIALSLVLVGGAIALARGIPAAGALALVALAGLVHGNAHGLEIPGTASGLGFAAGALATTAMLHGAGAGLAVLSARRPGLIAAFGAVTGLVGAVALVGAA